MNREDYQDNYDLIKELLSVVNGIKNVEEGLFSLHEDNLREALKFIYKNRESFSFPTLCGLNPFTCWSAIFTAGLDYSSQ